MNFTRHIAALGLCSAAALAIAPVAQAASIFGIGGIKFDQDTTVDFSFKSQVGSWVSTLGVYDTSGALLSSLFGETVGATASYKFLAGTEYTLGLSSMHGSNDKGTVFSTSTENAGNTQQAIFFGCDEAFADASCALNFTGAEKTAFANPSNFAGGEAFAAALLDGETIFISFDDRGNGNDVDFQDFTVSAKADVSVPEPASLMGLMVVGAAALKLRRRNDA
jgi:PEP-CTERM motif